MSAIEKCDGLFSLAYVARGNKRPWGATANEAHVSPGPMETDAALAGSRADFTAELRDLFTMRAKPTDGGKLALRVPEQFAVVRIEPETVLSVVGSRYVPVQFRDVAALANPAGLKWDSMGVVDGGVGFYGQALLGEDKIRRGDSVETLLTVTASHDGSSPVIAGDTTVNIVCANTLAMARKQARATINGGKVRHTSGANLALVSLANAIRQANERRKERVETFRALATIELTKDMVSAAIEASFPSKPASASGSEATDEDTPNEGVVATTRTLNVRNRVLEIFEAKKPETGVRATTAWDLLQAVTAYESHEKTVRGAENAVEAQNARWLKSTLEGSEATSRALEFLVTV